MAGNSGGWVWRRGTFTVPASVSHERVLQVMDRYARKFGTHLEDVERLKVLEITEPTIDLGVMGTVLEVTPPDRRRYTMWARVRPFKPNESVQMTVPDKWVSAFEKKGWKRTG